ncbi:MAG: DUF4435 domain-containing protein [Bacteroides sp.]|nr:DUF4435 domain-containing protein [Bacteroides sp.]
MSSGLVSNYSTKYIESKNELTGRVIPQISVLVEDESDIPFWYNLLNIYPKNFSFRLTPYSSEYGYTKGKTMLQKKIKDVGPFLIVCVDSDYDNILHHDSAFYCLIKGNPFVLQTYVYSVENYLLYHATLNDLILNSLYAHIAVDFEKLMIEYSKVIYPLLIISILFRKNKINGLNFDRFSELVSFNTSINAKNINTILTSTAVKITTAIAGFKVSNLFTDDEYHRLAESLRIYGIQPETAYLFMNGHILYDNFKDKVFVPIRSKIIQDKTNEFNSGSANASHKKSLIKHYKDITSSWETLLLHNFEFKRHCYFYKYGPLGISLKRLFYYLDNQSQQ